MIIKDKKTILMICSWLHHESAIGIFFREQAKILSEEYEFSLTNIREEGIGFRTFLKNKKLSQIEKHFSPEGLPIYYLKVYRFWFLGDLFENYFRKRALKKLLDYVNDIDKKINLIHAQSLFNAGYWAYWFNEWFNIPYVTTEHNQISFYGLKPKKRQLIDKVFSNSRKNLVVSYDKIRQFAANGVYGEFQTVGNFVDENRFYFSAQKKQSERFLTFTTIGSFAPIKDQKTLLKALELVSKNYPDQLIVLNWIGFNAFGGITYEKIEKFLGNFNFKNINLNLYEKAGRNQIAEILRDSDLFLFSSISEGLPVSVLEALSCGVPVVTTRCGGVDEVINGSNGEIVQIKDFIGMADFIEKFIQRKINFNRGEISKSAIKKFGSVAFKEKMRKIYEEALQKNF